MNRKMGMRAIAGLLPCLCGAAVQAYAGTDHAKERAGQEATASVSVKGMRDPDSSDDSVLELTFDNNQTAR